MASQTSLAPEARFVGSQCVRCRWGVLDLGENWTPRFIHASLPIERMHAVEPAGQKGDG